MNVLAGIGEGEMLSKEHTPTNRPIVERIQQIVFTGSYTDTGAEVEATAVVGKQSVTYDAVLRFVGIPFDHFNVCWRGQKQ